LKEEKIVILDRDGVINVDLMTYVTSPKEFEAIEGSLEAMAKLTTNGYKIAIATNQACIEKEIISEEELRNVHGHMIDLLSEIGGKINYIACCPHAPESKCKCRKPEVGLLQEIEQALNVPLKGKYFIGDKDSDIKAGRNFGCIPLLIKKGGYGEKVFGSENSPPDEHCFDNLNGAVSYILKQEV
jgi:D-glycero-D-manno-heptose 1,7-bisphosphate phosphatase